MKKPTSRRRFMRNSAFAMTGLAVFTPTISNALTFSECPFSGYNPYAERTNDLRRGIFGGRTLSIKGTIYETDGRTPVRNGSVEVWHLSPNSEKYRNRGKLQTDQNGQYQFITDFPNNEKGKQPRIYFKVSNFEKTTFTELVFNQSGPQITSAHWEKNHQLGEKLFPKQEGFSASSIIHFNISI